jgi:hypothetical protein
MLNAKAVVKLSGIDFKKFKLRISQQLKGIGIELTNIIKTERLSGPRPTILGEVTGTLKRSINSQQEEIGETMLVQKVGSFPGQLTPNGQDATSYAWIHEHGATVMVPEHMRLVSPKSMGFGRSEVPAGFMIEQTVRAHTATYPARPFISIVKKEQEQNIINTMRRVIGELIHGA